MNEELRKELKWCGFHWETCMESKRPIHPDYPYRYSDGDCVNQYFDMITLGIKRDPKTIKWWNKEWKEIIEYNPEIGCGLIKSIETVPVNSSIECEVMMPEGTNLWPSFWLTACDAWPPEIDIFEGYTDKRGSYFDTLGLHKRFPFIYRNVRMESNVHYKDDEDIHRQIKGKGDHKSFFKMPLELNWNHFKCNWYEDRIEFYINGKLHRTVTDEKVLSKMDTEGMWVIFNIWGNEDFDCSESGDINNFLSPMMIKNFKVTKL